MRWNEDVERRRREYHEHRCAEDALYRRAYERQQEEWRRIQRQAGEALTQLVDAMHADCMQRVNSITEDACCQPVKTHEEVMRERALMDEPDRNLDIENIWHIKSVLDFHKPHTQIIAVVHNPLLICALSKNPEVNFIEMTRGYVKNIRKMVKELV